MPFLLECLPVGALRANAYLLAGGTGRAVLVDPGDEAGRLLRAVAGAGLELEAVLLTHAHFDHVGGLAGILDALDVPVYLHPADLPLLGVAAASAASWGLTIPQPRVEPVELTDGMTLELAGLELEVLHTPGHAPGHVAFHLPAHQAVLSGDALFRGGIGRTDLPFGDHDQLLRSIREKLLTLPPGTAVHPGHGPATTVGYEAGANPFLAGLG